MIVDRSTWWASAASGDGHFLAHQLQPNLVLLQRRQQPLRPPASPVGATLLCHDQILLDGFSSRPDVV
jgi:hypothetical protein